MFLWARGVGPSTKSGLDASDGLHPASRGAREDTVPKVIHEIDVVGVGR